MTAPLDAQTATGEIDVAVSDASEAVIAGVFVTTYGKSTGFATSFRMLFLLLVDESGTG
jgi:hypothetical protein